MGRKDRGSRTHGKGSQRRGRGAGNRGGHGKAGGWKHERFPQKEQGKYGFKRPEAVQEDVGTINVGELDEYIEELAEEGIADRDGETYSIDLSDIGVGKLLGSGRVHNELHVGVGDASESATDKIKESGGEVET